MDLIVLPEMFSTGFTMNAERFAEPMDGPTLAWMQRIAGEFNAALAGSLIVKEESRFFNRLVFMRPDGTFDFYDKKHLFSMAGEHETFTPGKKRLNLSWRDWQICPMIWFMFAGPP